MSSGLRTLLRLSPLRVSLSVAATAGLLFAQTLQLHAQQPELRHAAPSRIVSPIDEHSLSVLTNHVRKDALSAHDEGLVEDSRELHLYLVLQRTSAQQADLENLIERQQQKGAAEYHQWLTPTEFGARFGASQEDIARLSQWLQSHGLQVRSVLNNGSMIDFSATSGQVREAFHTQLHYLNLRGGRYPALLQDPQIPAALAPVVAGIKGLNKVPAFTNHTEPGQSSYDETTHRFHMSRSALKPSPSPAYSDGEGDYLVAPKDLYTIYNVNPLLSAGHLAGSATVAVIEESDIEYGTVDPNTHVATGGDVANFRSLFGVPGTLNMHVYHGYGSVTCNDPGIDPSNNQEDIEASLDAEWINATAPSANEIFMSCDDSTDNGIFSSMAALVDNSLSDSMSLSYGESELYYTSGDYSAQDTLYAQAAAQGQSIFISSGDSGSDVADQNTEGTATSGINVSAFGSPLVTVTGGTDFQDTYDSVENGSPVSTYWSATNGSNYNDALSYVPEMPWNDACAGSILAAYYGYSGAGLCATGNFTTGGYVVGGSGGISTHYSVPSWQTGISGYSNSMHAQPDIAGFASSGFWGHALLFCDSNPNLGGYYNCTNTSTFGYAGGTSFVAPYMAGVGGMLTSYTGSRQGLLNPALYALAKTQYAAAATKSACYATGQTSNTGVTTSLPSSACIFNDITTGNNDVPCESGSTSCFVNSGASYGMLSLTGSGSLTVAYPSTIGFDQTTGIGSVNVNQLITKWNTAFSSSTSVTATPASITSSQSTVLKATVAGGTPTGYDGTAPKVTGSVSFKAGTTSLGSCTLSAGTCSLTVAGTKFASGANSVTGTYTASPTYPASTSTPVTVTVTGGSAVVSLSATSLAYGNQAINTLSASQTVTLTNTGSSTLTISSIVVGGANPSQYGFANSCGSTLAAGANCTIHGHFAPTSTGSKPASITITDNAANSPQTISLSGTGVNAPPTASLSVTSLAYGSQAINTISASQTVTLTNTGSSTLTISSIVVGGANPSQYAFANSCGSTLAAGANCTIHGHFAPTSLGSKPASISITDNASNSPQTITLSGTGVTSAPAVTLSATSVSFPATAPGSTSYLPVTVTNTGGGTLTVSSISNTGANPTDFSHTSNCGGTQIAPNSSCTVTISFTPAAAGSFTATLNIYDNVTGSPQSVTLSGTGN
jgi:subtilase family serine protease